MLTLLRALLCACSLYEEGVCVDVFAFFFVPLCDCEGVSVHICMRALIGGGDGKRRRKKGEGLANGVHSCRYAEEGYPTPVISAKAIVCMQYDSNHSRYIFCCHSFHLFLLLTTSMRR